MFEEWTGGAGGHRGPYPPHQARRSTFRTVQSAVAVLELPLAQVSRGGQPVEDVTPQGLTRSGEGVSNPRGFHPIQRGRTLARKIAYSKIKGENQPLWDTSLKWERAKQPAF